MRHKIILDECAALCDKVRMKSEHLSIRIPSDLKAALQKKAEAERRTLSNYVENILAAAVADKRRRA